ncbi:MAG: phosphoribosylamine--glycine ligase [Bacillota bacterium]
MKVLIVGGGGREHAIAWKLAQSPRVNELLAVPGNPGIARLARCLPGKVEEIEALADLARRERVNLTVVGPEAPLVAGIVDLFRSRGLRIFGPTAAAAQIEGSKAFAKQLMAAVGIPTAAFGVFTDPAAARNYLEECALPVVIKASGIAAGKGVVIARSREEARRTAEEMLSGQAFGEAGQQVVIEEFLEGQELSVMAFCDGTRFRTMVPAQDHKAVGDGDTGPNTGGMGTCSPVPVADAALMQRIEGEVIAPVLQAMADRGTPFQGVLFTGLMITADGPRVLEFNARFGDPETQTVLARLDSDLLEALEATIEGRLDQLQLVWSPEAAACVVLASGGYPGAYRKGLPIEGVEEAETLGAMVLHAGTAEKSGQLVTAGGRVFGVVGRGASLRQALDQAYRGAEVIRFPGRHFRRDIGWRALPSPNDL